MRRAAALALLLAAAIPARADFTPPPPDADLSAPPAASSAPAVAADTTTAAPAVSTGGVKVAGARKKPVLKRPILAHLHRAARGWRPLSLRAGGDPERARTYVELNLPRSGPRRRGERLKATASARLYKDGDEHWLVISVFPKPRDPVLARKRLHFEIRLRVVLGFVEEVRAAAVTLSGPGAARGAGLNARELDARGVAYEEDAPGSGEVLISALDPRPSWTAFNAGVLRRAAFAGRGVRLSDVSWKVRGLR